MNGKQGGYFYDWCANVTINPNLQGCYSANSDVLEAHQNFFDSGIDVVQHYATDGEHEAAKASLPDGGSLTEHDTTLKQNVNSVNTTHAIPRAEERDDEHVCFDDDADSWCF